MSIKKVLATFTLTSALFIGNDLHNQNEIEKSEVELEKSNNKVEELEYEQELKDSKIAELEDSLKDNEKDIEELDSKLDETLEENETLKEENDKLKSENEKLKEKSNSKQSESVGKSENFNESAKGVDGEGRKLNVEMTAYVAMCKEGCTGVTATGVDIRNTLTYQGHRIIATDPSVIPLHSIVEVNVNGNTFTAISLDIGGAINGNIVDFLVGSESEARKFGRQQATITVLREGK